MVILLTFLIHLLGFLCPETGMILYLHLITYSIKLIFFYIPLLLYIMETKSKI